MEKDFFPRFFSLISLTSFSLSTRRRCAILPSLFSFFRVTLASVLPLANVSFYFSRSLRTFPFSCILWFLAAFSLLRIIRWPVTSFFCTRTFSLLCCLFTFTSQPSLFSSFRTDGFYCLTHTVGFTVTILPVLVVALTRSLVAFVCPTGSFRLVFTRRPTTSSVFRSLFSGPSFLAFLLREIIASGFVPWHGNFTPRMN